MTPEPPEQPGTRPGSGLLGPRLAAVFLLVLGALALSQTFQIGRGAGYIVVGPRFFPTVVAAGLLGLGFAFLLRTTVFPDLDLAAETAAEEAVTHWSTVALLLLALVAYAFLLAPLGYTVATALLFPVIARILGSNKPLRDFVIGLVLGLIVYVVFTRVLGVRLPAGLLQGIL